MSSQQRKKITILMVNMFIAIASFGIIVPILPAYLVSINQGGTAAGLMIAIFAGAQLLFSPLGGKWADIYGPRKVIILGLSLLTVSMLMFYATDSIWLLYASRIVGGIGDAFLVPGIFTYVAGITTAAQRAKGTGLVTASMSLGLVIGPGIGGFLADFDLKLPFLVSAIVTFTAVVFSMVMLKEIAPTADSTKQAEEFAKDESMLEQIGRSVKMPYFIPLIITFVMSFGLVAYESVIGMYLTTEYGSTSKDIAMMITATGLVSVIVQVFVVDRLVRRFGEVPVLIAFLGLATAGFLLSLVAGSYASFFGVSLVIFLAMAILRPVLNILISKMAEGEVGFAMGMNTSYMSLGNVLGPLSAGLLFDFNINYPFILGLGLLIVTLSIAMAWRSSRAAKALALMRIEESEAESLV
ncbi:MFS transporter [Planomicrobium chinense]|uniref:MFS transporter n=1 Tax=Planococcus chinensis TaxID=272917 RepID=UPI001CC59B73|nr:MFS transporter [Planococcus chinensis]MBZ5199962.1 MFS transporter [Planococcus chinensis]MCP2034066.1 DHA1 family multidrug resistance protein-like MFS transporter [Planomicrobium sp. HSC-17F08]